MLASSLLSTSLRQGVVRLIPRVRGVPTASQLRPITLLGTDYKLLTKMIVSCLFPLLPSVLHAMQLCSVRGHYIHNRPASVLSAAKYQHQRHLTGFLPSLDFFHAYDMQHHLGVAPSPTCTRCRLPAADETILHFLTACEWVSASWSYLLFRATLALGCTLSDESLLS
jgi:hypothetical protein